MPISANKKSIIGLIIIFAVIVAGVSIRNQIIIELGDDQQLVQQSYAILEKITSTSVIMQDIELGTRGYIMTHNKTFLEPYTAGIENIDVNVKELIDLTSDTPIQQEKISKLEDLINKKIEFSSTNIGLVDAGKGDQAVKNTESGYGVNLFNEIRNTINEMRTLEFNNLDDRSNVVVAKSSYLANISAVFSAVIFSTVVIIFMILDKDAKKRSKQIQHLLDAQKQLTEKLKETDTIKEEFSAMITHELKTPIVPIVVYCKMLKSSMMGNLNKEQTDAINVIEKNVKSLDHLINDVMDARKLDMKKLKFNIEDVNLEKFLEDIRSSYEPVLIQRGHSIIMNVQDKHMIIKTDKMRLRQVFDNLISNALKFIPEQNGIVEIGLKKENDSVVMHIKDNGSGIPLDKQSKLFQKFYQVDTSARRKITGTGLGLAISKGIVEQLGGEIYFESDEKVGTVFFVRLPIK